MIRGALVHSLTQLWNQLLFQQALLLFCGEWHLETKNWAVGFSGPSMLLRVCVHDVHPNFFSPLMIGSHTASNTGGIWKEQIHLEGTVFYVSLMGLSVYICIDVALPDTTPEWLPIIYVSTCGT